MKAVGLAAALSALVVLACSGGADDGRTRASAGSHPAASSGSGSGPAGSPARGEALFQRGEASSDRERRPSEGGDALSGSEEAPPEGGEARSGQPITAVVGPGDVPVSAASLPCAGCHGKDGRGRSEGGVSPPNVRWDALTRPYEVTATLGRRRGPYTAPLVVRAVTMGVDASGQRLDPVMPRYRLSQRDAADLVAYLRTLDRAEEPGLTAVEVRVGGLFSRDAEGDAARSAVTALFEEIGARQGIFGRRPVLDRGPALPSTPASSKRDCFAMVGVVDSDALGRSVIEGIPTVIAAADDVAPPAGEGLFVLHGGMPEEAESLLALAAQRTSGRGRALVLRGPGAAADKAARRVMDACSRVGFARCTASAPSELPSGEALSVAGVAAVFVLGWTGDTAPLGDALARIPGAPPIFVAGGFGAFEASKARPSLFAGAPRSLEGRLFVAAWPKESDAASLADYPSFAARHALSREHVSAQRRALSAASVLVEALRRAGRDATREGVIRAIEGIRDHDAWIGPPLSFGRSRHVGATPPVFSVDPGGRLSPTGDPAPLL